MIVLWNNGKTSCDLMSPDLAYSIFTLFLSDVCVRVRREVDEAMYPSSLWRQCYDVGLLQLVSSRLSNVMWQNEVSWLPECTEWPGSPINGFFSSVYSRMITPGYFGLRLWRSVLGSMRNHFHKWTGHPRVLTLTPLKVFEMCWRLYRVVWLSCCQKKIFAYECKPEMNIVMLHKVAETIPWQSKLRVVRQKSVQLSFSKAVY